MTGDVVGNQRARRPGVTRCDVGRQAVVTSRWTLLANVKIFGIYLVFLHITDSIKQLVTCKFYLNINC
jgi:hypothetical protein